MVGGDDDGDGMLFIFHNEKSLAKVRLNHKI